MLDLLYSTTMLAFESSRVVNLRVARICLGGESDRAESVLMVNEKISAGIEMLFGIAEGTTPSEPFCDIATTLRPISFGFLCLNRLPRLVRPTLLRGRLIGFRQRRKVFHAPEPMADAIRNVQCILTNGQSAG